MYTHESKEVIEARAQALRDQNRNNLDAILERTLADIHDWENAAKTLARCPQGYITLDEYGTIGYTADASAATPIRVDDYLAIRASDWEIVPEIFVAA